MERRVQCGAGEKVEIKFLKGIDIKEIFDTPTTKVVGFTELAVIFYLSPRLVHFFESKL